MWVLNSDCKDGNDQDCPNNHYNYHESRTYKSVNNGTAEEIKYGMGEVKGYVVNDHIALGKRDYLHTQELLPDYMKRSSTAENVNFLSVFFAKDLEGLQSDGLLGLSPMFPENSGQKRLTTSGEKEHLLVNELFHDGIIGRRMFSAFLSDSSQGISKIEFGGYDESIPQAYLNTYKSSQRNTNWLTQGGGERHEPKPNSIEPPTDGIYWLDVTSFSYWAVEVTEVRLNDKKIESTFTHVIFDTGSSMNYIPEPEYNAFLAIIKKGKNCFTYQSVFYCNCDNVRDSGWPELKMLLGSTKKASE